MEKLQETYEIKSEDNELHVIGVMLETMERHLKPVHDQATKEEWSSYLESKTRCIRYVMDRIEAEHNEA